MLNEDILSDESRKAMDFVNLRANDITTKSRAAAWEANVRANRKYYQAEQATLRGLSAYIVAAGPSLEKNAPELRRVGRLGVVICVDAALRHLLSVGVRPDYCVAIDSGDRCSVFHDGLDTSGITLVCMTTSSPAVISAWRGPRYFVQGNGGSADGADKIFALSKKVISTRDIKSGETLEWEDLRTEFPGVIACLACGGNVTTAAFSFAWDILRAVKIIYVGADYSWEDGAFYAGGHYKELAHERQTVERVVTHPDVNGRTVNTNLSLASFKNWHEARAIMCINTHVNATEGGILGVGDAGDCRGRLLPGWEFLTLREAVDKYTPPTPEQEAALAAKGKAVEVPCPA